MRIRVITLILFLMAVLVATGWRGSSPAPIYNVALHINESDPPQYSLKVISGLPNTCHTFDRADVERSGTEIAVSVINFVAGAAASCDDGPWWWGREYSLVDLGDDFEPGVTYTVRVNEVKRTLEGGLGEVEATHVPAPIHEATVTVDDSSPPRYFVESIFFSPFHCDTLDETTNVHRSGLKVGVSVVNRIIGHGTMVNADPCGWGGRNERRSIALGSDFDPGATYVVQVNDWQTFFRLDPKAFQGSIKRGTLKQLDRWGDEYSARGPQIIPERFPPLGNGEHVVLGLDPDHTRIRPVNLNPPRYVLEATIITNSYPTLRRIDVRKSGDKIEMRPVGYPGPAVFVSLFREVSLSVDLGSDFESGVRYTVYSQGRIVAGFTAW